MGSIMSACRDAEADRVWYNAKTGYRPCDIGCKDARAEYCSSVFGCAPCKCACHPPAEKIKKMVAAANARQEEIKMGQDMKDYAIHERLRELEEQAKSYQSVDHTTRLTVHRLYRVPTVMPANPGPLHLYRVLDSTWLNKHDAELRLTELAQDREFLNSGDKLLIEPHRGVILKTTSGRHFVVGELVQEGFVGRDALRARALEKLSEEERKALGL